MLSLADSVVAVVAVGARSRSEEAASSVYGPYAAFVQGSTPVAGLAVPVPVVVVGPTVLVEKDAAKARGASSGSKKSRHSRSSFDAPAAVPVAAAVVVGQDVVVVAVGADAYPVPAQVVLSAEDVPVGPVVP